MTNKARKTRSLKLSLVLTLTFALFVAIAVYLVFEVVATAMIDNVYLSAENKEKREAAYVADLQKYVLERGLTGEDSEDFARWAQTNRYVYLMIYKDDQLFFDSGSYEPPEPIPTPKPDEDGGKTDEPTDPDNPSDGEGADPDSGDGADTEGGNGTADSDNPSGGEDTDDPEGGDGTDPDNPGGTDPDGGDSNEGGEPTDPDGGEAGEPDGTDPDNPSGGEGSDPDNPDGGEPTDPEGGEGSDKNPEGGNEDDPNSGAGSDEPTDAPSEKPNEGGTNPPQPGTGITVRFPTREELMKYAEENDAHIVNTADEGILVVNMADFTEYFYYDIVNITSIVLAMIALFIIIIIHYNGLTTRISHLAQDVRVIAAGDMEHKISAKGSDEISELSTNVEDMRSAILDNIAKERAVMEANAELITSMSHDIRTPLTVLLGYLDIMKDKVDEDGQMREYVEASEKTALRLKKLSDDLFNYFLLFGSGAATAVLEEYEVGMLLDQMLSEHALLLRESGYDVRIEKGAELDGRRILTDPTDLVRIFENLFSNIMKYADKSAPVSISAEVKDGKLRLKFYNKTAKVHYAESNGIGLKTCKKLAERLSAEIEWREGEDDFEVALTFDIVRTK